MESTNDVVTLTKIVRHSQPSLMDQLPKGCLCMVTLENGKTETWEQRSEDTTNPVWVLIE